MISKIDALNAIGINCQGYFFTENASIQTGKYFKEVKYMYDAPKVARLKFLWRAYDFILKRRRFKFVDNYIRDLAFDFIIIRYPGSDIWLRWFCKKHFRKVILELNSLHLNEINNTNQRKYFLDKYRIWSEIVYFPKVCQNIAGLVAVTDEILKKEIERSKYNGPSIAISNGYNYSDYQAPNRSIQFDSTILRMVISIGASDISRFGLDRLARSYNDYTGSTKIEIHIIGNISQMDKKYLMSIVKNEVFYFHGYLSPKDCSDIYSRCHLGFAALAMWRIPLNMASTLKFREYLANGLPVMLAYDEVGLDEDSALSKYIIKFNNDDSLINFERVIDFLLKVYSDPNYHRNIYNFGKLKYSYEVFAEQYCTFIKNILGD